MVVLDTNAVFWPVAPGVRIEAELERIFPGGARVVVPRSVLGELDRLAALGVPNAETARRLAGSWPVSRSSGRGDDAVLDCARRLSGIVATADRGLI
ncbi:MAG TPA: hypothetical protein VJQ43_06145 [Thermoplasmata archaeon]|nr:hypothetical protein [Thermoplasmata archaeon]